MRYLKTNKAELIKAERWDYDYHEAPILIQEFDKGIIKKVSEVADIIRVKKDPTKTPDKTFQYIDISSVAIETGEIEGNQELTGSEAPSRARKLVQAYDIIISTCRPTRKAIAVVPEHLHGQICSTGFSVIRAKKDINPLYLHFALRLDSTMEQFRKFATGSSYPAILDSDVEKTLIPVPTLDEQNNIVKRLVISLKERKQVIAEINSKWNGVLSLNIDQIKAKNFDFKDVAANGTDLIYSNEQIVERINQLPQIEEIEELEDEDEQMELDFVS